ncbi:MAG TPA: CsbD family protein [Terracidiphilus sp.]|jgi:uncharacterized protein YjbJ (UPF0337 family)
MNNDKVKGSLDDAAGRVKRQVGEWTGNTETQVEGAAQQVKGKAEKAVGNLRDAVNNAGTKRDVDVDRDIDDNTGRETVHERETIRERK